MKTHEVRAVLRAHYKPAEYALMFEVGNSTGSGVSRHADAVAMGLWPSRGLIIEGIEIKVSRADWRRELENPAKAEAVAKYCDMWWIVAPEGIVQEIELPALWGLKVVTEKGVVRTVKKAPMKDVVPADRGFIAAMLRRASEADHAMVDALVNAKVAAERADIQKEIDRAVEGRTRHFVKIEEKVTKMKEAGFDLTQYRNADEMIEDWRMGNKIRRTHGVSGLNYTADNLVRVAETLREVHAVFSGADASSNS